MKPIVLALLFMAACGHATAGGLPDPCGLLSPNELSELGLTDKAIGAVDSRDGGRLLICKFLARPEDTAGPGGISITVMVSAAGGDRVLQFDALVAKARSENTPSALSARGEYYAESGSAMCKVTVAAAVETSQCLGATGTTVIALAVERPAPDGRTADPTVPLKLISEMAARVRQAGN